MPVARASETSLSARDAGFDTKNSSLLGYRISAPIVVVVIICSVVVFVLAAAMTSFFLWRSNRRSKRTSPAADNLVPPVLDHYTQPPRWQSDKEERRSKRKHSYSSSTSDASSHLDALNSLPELRTWVQPEATTTPPISSPPLARTSSIHTVACTTGSPARRPPLNRRCSSSVHQLVDVEAGRKSPPQPTRVSLPLSTRPTPPLAPPPSRSMRDSMTVEQMLELMPDARLSYAVMF